MRSSIMVVLFLGIGVACEVNGSFDVPDEPKHDKFEHGFAHARGLEVPFLCGIAGSPNRFRECEQGVRPEPALMSCDASGCHGDTTYDEGPRSEGRHLLGSDGPSCWACHNREWDLQKTGTASGDD